VWSTKLPSPSVIDSSSFNVSDFCSSLLAPMWSCFEDGGRGAGGGGGGRGC
jgi:hypothetical protein